MAPVQARRSSKKMLCLVALGAVAVGAVAWTAHPSAGIGEVVRAETGEQVEYGVGEPPGESAGGETEDLQGAFQYWAQRHQNVSAADYLRAQAHTRAMPHARHLPAPRGGGKGAARISSASSATLSTTSTLSIPSTTSLAAPAATQSGGAPWSSLGPQPINPGFGGVAQSGRATSVAFAPGSPNVIYLGTANGGVWKTTDGGASWSPRTDKEDSLAIGAVAVDPKDASVVLAGTGEPNQSADSYLGNGVLRSTDAGATWTLRGASVFGTRKAQIARILFDPVDHNHVWAAATTGLFESTDQGVTWAKAGLTTGSVSVDDIAANSDGSTVLATVRGSGIWKLTAGSWAQVTGLPAGSSFAGRSLVTFAPSDDTVAYVQTTASSFGEVSNLLYSTDGGATWAFSATSPSSSDSGQQGWYDLVLAVDPLDALRVYVGATDLVVTTDAQAASVTWTNLTNVYSSPASGVHPDQHGLTFLPGCASSPCPFLLANDGGAWRSGTIAGSPSGTFVNLNTNLNTAEFTGGDISPNFTASPFLLAGTQDNGTMAYNGPVLPSTPQPWPMIQGGDGGPSAIDWASPGTVYAQFQTGVLRKYTNGGTSVVFQRTLPTSLFYAPLTIGRVNTQHLLWGANYVAESMNGASSFYKGSQNFPSYNGRDYVTALAIDPSSDSTEYAASYGGRLWKTTAGGSGTTQTWTQIDQGAFTSGYISGIAVDPADPNTVVVSVSGYYKGDPRAGSVYKTTDGGGTWTNITGNLPKDNATNPYPVNTVMTYRSGGGLVIVAGTDYGVAFTIDGGGTWTMLDGGLPNASVTDLVMDRDSGTVVAYTYGRGAWQLSAAPSADVTPPAVTVTLSAPNSGTPDGTSGWFKTGPVTGTVTADDTTSGGSTISSIGCTTSLDGAAASPLSLSNEIGIGTSATASGKFTVSGQGTTTLSCTATDVQTNMTSPAATSTVKLDTSGPTLAPSVSPSSVTLGGSATASANATDTVAGVASASCDPVDTAAVGSFTVSCTATDNAGNTSTGSASYTVGATFGGFLSPLTKSTLAKSTSSIPVKFTLRDANGQLSSSVAAALAANGQVRAVLSGPGISGPIVATAACTWNAIALNFQCNIRSPKGLLTGRANPYLISAQEKGTVGSFVNAPGAGNPETVYFK